MAALPLGWQVRGWRMLVGLIVLDILGLAIVLIALSLNQSAVP